MNTIREFTAMTQSKKGGTQAVIVMANSADEARTTLLRMGYHVVLWVL